MQTTTPHSPETVSTKIPVTEQPLNQATAREELWLEPPVNVYETDEATLVLVDLPGVEAADIHTDLKDNQLTLTARVRPLEEKWRPLYQEGREGHYTRHFRLGQQIDQAKISAQLKDGILTLTLPKAEAVKPRKIQVKVS